MSDPAEGLLKRRWWRRFFRITTSGEYIRELDGLRFLAIGVVLTAHTWGNWLNHTATTYVLDDPSFLDVAHQKATMHGKLGVQLFFIISGFILSLPWARHFLAGGRPIRLKSYYLRRLTRLEPPYIIIMVAYFLMLTVIGRLSFHEHWGNLLATLFYVHNATYGTGSVIYNAAWSLEIEVQFYLLAPFFAMAIYRLPDSGRHAMLVCLIVFFASSQTLFPGLPPSLLYQGHFFMAGFLLSEFFVRRGEFWRKRGLIFDVLALAGWGLAFFVLPAHATGAIVHSGYLCGLSMVFVCGFKGRLFSAFLRLPLICAIGGMCYTIYLLHGRILTFVYAYLGKHLQLTGSYLSDHIILNAVMIPLVVAISAVFFVLVERPCMDRHWPRKLWKRLFPESTSGRDRKSAEAGG